MVVIRLTRVGKKKQAHYRIVVADSRRAVKGKFISILGWYNPHTKELEVKKDELKSWLDKGAKPSNTLAKLLKKEGVKLPAWVKIEKKKKAPKKKEKEPKKEAPKTEEKLAKGEEKAGGKEEAPTSGGDGVPTDNVGKEKPAEAEEVKEEQKEEEAKPESPDEVKGKETKEDKPQERPDSGKDPADEKPKDKKE